MKKVLIIAVVAMFVGCLTSVVQAGGDKVRGEEGQGSVNQVGFDNQGNQG